MKRLKLLSIATLVLFMVNTGVAQNNDDDSTDNYRSYRDDTKRKKYRFGTHRDFSVDLGINNWLEDGEFPNDNDEIYSVRPWGSWYVGLNIINDTHITGPLHLEWGVGVSWYSLRAMLQGLKKE